MGLFVRRGLPIDVVYADNDDCRGGTDAASIRFVGMGRMNVSMEVTLSDS